MQSGPSSLIIAPSESVVVFLGPTLSIDEAQRLLPADYRPPAAMGDIYATVREGVRAIILIDGVFHCEPAVWQREIDDALQAGIRVFGCSSMGALRAAELEPFGMEGRGQVFEWYRDGVIDSDDEVALLHADATRGYAPMSEPLVNIRYTLDHLHREGLMDSEEIRQIIAEARQLHYPERSWRAVSAGKVVGQWPAERQTTFRRLIDGQRVDIKRRDACALLTSFASFPESSTASDASPPNRLPESHRYEIARLHHSRFQREQSAIPGSRLRRFVRENWHRFQCARLELAKVKFLTLWSDDIGNICPEDYLETFRITWEREHGFTSDRAWLCAHGLTRRGYRALLKRRALASRVAHDGAEPKIPLWNRPTGVCDDDEALLLTRIMKHWGIKAPRIENDGDAIPGLCPSVNWFLRHGPNHFGYPWDEASALARELQLRGLVHELL